MQRTTEPELMDTDAQALAYALADFSAPHQHFVELCSAVMPVDTALDVLDLGCGPADVTVRFALAYPRVKVDGVDGSAPMLALGRERVTRENLAHRVALHTMLLPAATLPRPRYGAVISNSLLHHLHDPLVLWRTVRQAASPGATVCIMDLRRPDHPDVVDTLVRQHAADAPDVLRQDFRASLHAAFTVEEVQQQLKEAGLMLKVDAVGDRHLFIHGHVG
jgi:SAM-dependent methyltransferase